MVASVKLGCCAGGACEDADDDPVALLLFVLDLEEGVSLSSTKNNTKQHA